MSSSSSSSTREMAAFSAVARECHDEVVRVCQGEPLPLSSLLWSSPFASSPFDLLNDFSRTMDEIMSSSIASSSSLLFATPPVVPMQQKTMRISFPPPLEEDPADDVLNHDELAVRSIVNKLFSSVTDNDDDFAQVHERMTAHGRDLIDRRAANASPVMIRVARRLTALTPEDVRAIRRNDILPFGEHNGCMQEAFEREVLRPSCGAAMHGLARIRTVRDQQAAFQRRQESKLLAQVGLFYAFLACTAIILMIRRSRNRSGQRRLKIRIMKAIYSRPELKQELERSLGESIGHVPPLSWPALHRFGLHGRFFRRGLAQLRKLRAVVILALCLAFLLAPAMFLPLCVAMASLLCWIAACSPQPVRACACCTCGATTDDVMRGTLSKEQACCCCCQGTAVCSASCKECNAPAPDTEGCCGDLMLKEEDSGCCGKAKKATTMGGDEYRLVRDDDGCCCGDDCDDGCCGSDKCCCEDNGCDCCDDEKKKTGSAADYRLMQDDCCCGDDCDDGCCGPDKCCCEDNGCDCCDDEKKKKATAADYRLMQDDCCCGDDCDDGCCGPDKCCCEDNGCQCCDDKKVGRGKKHTFPAQKHVYQGVPIQIV